MTLRTGRPDVTAAYAQAWAALLCGEAAVAAAGEHLARRLGREDEDAAAELGALAAGALEDAPEPAARCLEALGPAAAPLGLPYVAGEDGTIAAVADGVVGVAGGLASAATGGGGVCNVIMASASSSLACTETFSFKRGLS